MPYSHGRALSRQVAPLERDCERLRCQLVGDVSPHAPMEIPVNGGEMPIEDRLEGRRLPQRARHAIRVRRSRLHHPVCARSTKRSFTTGPSRSAQQACYSARSGRRNSACRARGEMTRYDSVEAAVEVVGRSACRQRIEVRQHHDHVGGLRVDPQVTVHAGRAASVAHGAVSVDETEA